jgi:uncharacterized protein (DUF983 family)
MTVPQSGAVSVIRAGWGCRCPRCGRGPLFDGLLTIRPTCRVCGLDFRSGDTGDGPAVFVIMIVGFIVVGGALLLETLVMPPFWLHAAVWLPLTLVLALALLRPFKATLYALQYRHRRDMP